QLYSSLNGGPWELSTTATPGQRGFEFRTARDGSYSFAVRVLFDGYALPERLDQLRPTLSVVVDTPKPDVILRRFSPRPGVVGVQWEVRDENLDTNAIRLEGRWAGQEQWLPLDADGRPGASGERTWSLQPTQRLEVRLRASDLARNVGE